MTHCLFLIICLIPAVIVSTLDAEKEDNYVDELKENLSVLKRALALRASKIPNNEQQDPELDDYSRHPRSFVNNYYLDFAKRPWGRYIKIHPGLVNIGLGKRTVHDPGLKYIGLGKKDTDVNINKKSVSFSGLKYIGLGKRQTGYGLKFMGIGKRNYVTNSEDEEEDGGEENKMAVKNSRKSKKGCWENFGSRGKCNSGWRRLRTRSGANSWGYFHKFRRMLVNPKLVMMGIGK